MKINEVIDPNMISNMPAQHRGIAANHGLLMHPELVRAMAFMETVKSDCQPYLKEVDYSPMIKYRLYRGVIGTTKPYIAKRVRLDDRTPKDTSAEVHNKINEYFQENYGAPFRNGIHTTGNHDQAAEYAHGGFKTGELYIVFPVGKFEYLWSPQVSDMLDAIYESEVFDRELGIGKKTGWNEFAEKNLSTYQTTGLKEGIRSGHEIMIRSKEYWGLKYADPLTDNHFKAFEELLRS